MTQTEQILATKTVTIDSNLADKEGYLVSLDTTDEDVVNISDANSVVSFPLITGGDGSTTALLGTIATYGLVKVKCGGTITAGNRLKADANGKAIVATAGLNYSLIAMSNGVANDIIVAKIDHGSVPA